MDQSYITHQRRPALIPANIELSPEDEQSVRLRTGYVNPTPLHDAVFFNSGFEQGTLAATATAASQQSSKGKRKAEVLEEDRSG